MKVTIAAASLAVVGASTAQEGRTANPIRRVVSMLQNMQKKVEKEVEEQAEMFENFQCYCTKNTEKLQKSIEESKVHVEDLKNAIGSDGEMGKQLELDLVQHKEERSSAQEAVESAEAIRAKENKAVEEESADLKQNLKAMEAAIVAIEKGTGQAFLQSPGAAILQHVAAELVGENQRALEEFLQQSAAGAGSDEIVGILKTMVDEMSSRLSEIEENEKESVANHGALVSAKKAEIGAAQIAIEEKTARHGELAVKIATDENDLKSTTRALGEDEQYLEQLGENCDKHSKDYAEIKKTQAGELLAIAETIKILNSDDALELFKKALPSPALLQVSADSRELRKRAAEVLRSVRGVNVDLVLLSMQGKKEGFDEVLKMIDNMVKELHVEMDEDVKTKEYCGEELNHIEDKLKDVSRHIEGLEADIEAHKQTIEKTTAQVKDLNVQIKDLDKAVAEATKQRKQENEAYVSEAAQNRAALELLEFAKNRMNKFYAPEQHKEPPPEELSEEEKIEQAYSFVQIAAHHGEAPPPPPTVGTHSKQEGGNGVLSLLNNIMSDLKLEMNEDKLAEEDAQQDYEKLSADATEKRAALSDSLAESESALADAHGDLLDLEGDKTAAVKDQGAAHETEMRLHAECDWLVANFETRKEAREGEIDALEKAKAVLSGADFSLIETRSFLAKRP